MANTHEPLTRRSLYVAVGIASAIGAVLGGGIASGVAVSLDHHQQRIIDDQQGDIDTANKRANAAIDEAGQTKSNVSDLSDIVGALTVTDVGCGFDSVTVLVPGYGAANQDDLCIGGNELVLPGGD